MLYLGFDLSLTETGWCKIRENGKVLSCGVMKHKESYSFRLSWYYNEFYSMFFEGDFICGVEGFSYASPFQAHQIGELHGVFKLAWHALREKEPLHIYSPTQIKQFATGKGNAKKDEMLLAVYKKWGFETRNHNIADAFAIAQLTKAHCEVLAGRTKDTFLAYEWDLIQKIIHPSPKKRKSKKGTL